VWDTVFSADSLYLVTVSSDQSGKLWDLRTSEVVRNYTGHNLAVTCVALNDSSN
jgi:G protein beta subunit-like protein